MLRRIFLSILILTFVFFAFYVSTQSKDLDVKKNEINYQLPYPGILPDHPFYKIKTLRDGILEFFTRDSLKKAQLYLLFSDKRLKMGIDLSAKNKWEQALVTVLEAERYFQKIPDALTNLKKQGRESPVDFTDKLKIANKKHQEVIETLIKKAPKSQKKGFQDILKLTKENSVIISSI